MNSHRDLIRWISVLGVACLVGAALQMVVLWATDIPLGVTDEWVWLRFPLESPVIGLIWPAIFGGLALLLVMVYGARFLSSQSSRRNALLLGLLWGVGFFWMMSAAASTSGIGNLSRIPFVLFYTRSSGYFTQAVEHIHDVSEFIRTYHERISDETNPENHLHQGTHPPGITLSLMWMLKVFEGSSFLTDLSHATMPEQVVSSNQTVMELNAASGRTELYSRPQQAVIWTAALITALFASGTVVPVFLLASRFVDAEAAWWTAGLWLLVPAATIFIPKSDVMFPFLALWAQWVWLRALDKNSLCKGFLTSLIMLFASTLSLAFAPIGLMLFLQGVLLPARRQIVHTPDGQRKVVVDRAAVVSRSKVFAGGVAAVVVWLALWAIFGKLNLLAVFVQNITNHASFYTHHTRTYLSWLVETPIELAFSLGLPLAVLGGVGTLMLLKERLINWQVLIIPVAVWIVLWVSGKNMGETARLWVFLMPYACLPACVCLRRVLQLRNGDRVLALLFCLQMIVCLATVIRIDGFGFLEL